MKPPRDGHMLADGLAGADAEGRHFAAYGGLLRGVPGDGGYTPWSGGEGAGDSSSSLGGGGGGSMAGGGGGGNMGGATAYGGSGGGIPGGVVASLVPRDDEDQSLASLSYRYTTRKSGYNRYPANTAVARFSRRSRMEATLRRARGRAAASIKALFGAARSAHIFHSDFMCAPWAARRASGERGATAGGSGGAPLAAVGFPPEAAAASAAAAAAALAAPTAPLGRPTGRRGALGSRRGRVGARPSPRGGRSAIRCR